MVKKDIVLFGTGSIRYGVEVKPPDVLRDMDRDTFYVVICTAQKEAIEKQLVSMGITDYHYYRPVPIEDLVLKEEQKPYRIGYVPGAFDLFHVGHLNLLRRSKSRCEYLIAGVLTDELFEHFKKRKPVISYEQRAAIVSAVSYVDRVVPVDYQCHLLKEDFCTIRRNLLFYP